MSHYKMFRCGAQGRSVALHSHLSSTRRTIGKAIQLGTYRGYQRCQRINANYRPGKARARFSLCKNMLQYLCLKHLICPAPAMVLKEAMFPCDMQATTLNHDAVENDVRQLRRQHACNRQPSQGSGSISHEATITFLQLVQISPDTANSSRASHLNIGNLIAL